VKTRSSWHLCKIVIAISVICSISLTPRFAKAVDNGSISGQVTDAGTAAGIANVYVVCYPWGYRVQTDAVGNYTLTSLPPATYTVTAAVSGYHYAAVDGVVVTASGPGLQQENIDFSLSPASSAVPDGFESDNTFQEAKDIWVDASVSFQPPHVHNFHQTGDEDWVRFYAEGTIVNPKPYTIKTSNLGVNCDTIITLYDQNQQIIRGPSDDYWEGEDEELSWSCPAEGYYYVRISPGEGTVFGANSNYDLSIFVPTGGIGFIVGTVKNGLNNQSITGAKLTTSIGGIALSLQGAYTMVSSAGICSATAEADNYLTATVNDVTINEGQETTVDFVLAPDSLPNITGIATNLNGLPALDDTVEITINTTGEITPLYYQVWRLTQYGTPGGGTWQRVTEDWSENNSAQWIPESHDNSVVVGHITNDTTRGVVQQAGLTIETSGNSANTVQIISFTAANLGSPHPPGTPVTFATEATEGAGPLSYEYWQREGVGGSWSRIKNYSPDNTCVWNPARAGVYTIVGKATDDVTMQFPPQAGMTCIVGE
jgi:hypothetical protein